MASAKGLAVSDNGFKPQALTSYGWRAGAGALLAAVLVGLSFLLSGPAPAQGPPRASRAHMALNEAIDSHRRGEYERAAGLFDQALAAQKDLSNAERQELARVMQINSMAMNAQKSGAEQLRLADKAVREGRLAEAGDLLKRVTANPYLPSADRQKAQQLTSQLGGRPSGTPSPSAPGAGDPLSLARGKLQQARALLNQANFDAAEQLAREAERLKAAYPPGDDTPQKVLNDASRTRGDAKGLLGAARQALQANDLDRAERLAGAAKKADSGWNMHLFGDSPDKVIKDVQTARARTAQVKTQPPRPTPPPPQPPVQTSEKDSPGMLGAVKGLFTSRKAEPTPKKEETPAPNRTPTERGPNQTPPAKGPAVNPVEQRQPSETKAATGPTAGKPPAGKPPASNVAAKPPASEPAKPVASAPAKSAASAPAKPAGTNVASRSPNTEQARQLMTEARRALQKGDLDQANKLTEQARKMRPELPWWEDTPEKLQADIQRAANTRQVAARNTTPPAGPAAKPPTGPAAKPPADVAAKPSTGPAVKPPVASAPAKPEGPKPDDPRAMVKQGRELFDQGKLDEAAQVARKAKAASSSVKWGMFEYSPDKLLQDVDRARAKRDQSESWHVLAEGRKLLEQGDLDNAAKLAHRADKLHGPYGMLDLGDRPDRLLADVQSARDKQRKLTVPPVPPAGFARNEPRNNQTGPARPGAGTPTQTASNTNTNPKTANTGAPTQTASASPPPRPAVQNPPAPPPQQGPRVQPVQQVQQIQQDPRVQQVQMLTAEGWNMYRNNDIARAQVLLGQAEALQASTGKPADENMLALKQVLAQVRGPAVQPPAPAPVVDAAKQQAVPLLAQARQLQKEGKLVEARQKVLECQRLNASFGPDEDSPDHAMLQLASLARKQIDSLMLQAGDLVATAAAHPGNHDKAEQALQQAHQLAAGFGLDLQPIEAKIAWVRQSRTPSVASVTPPPVPVQQPSQPPQPPVPQQPAHQQPPAVVQVADGVPGGQPPLTPNSLQETGRDLLAKAREALRAGQSKKAREITHEVYKGPYNLVPQAEALLRDIDTEEFNQTQLAANRTFTAAHSAFLRKDYPYAAALLQSIDVRLLDGDKQARLKELMATPEMQPSALARGTAPVPPDGPKATDSGPQAVVRVTDTRPPESPDSGLAAQVQAMRKIKQDEMRQKGLEARRQAQDRFKAGDTERALELLQEYLASLSGLPLDAEELALLRRPVEAQLQQFRTLRAQRDFEELQAQTKQARTHGREVIARNEENKQQKVKQLMDQFNTLYKEGKYKEAQYKAMLAKELDPDNSAATAAVLMAKLHYSESIARTNKDGRERFFFGAASDAEDQGPYTDLKSPIFIDKDAYDRAKKRGDISIINLRGRGEKEREIESQLLKPVTLNFKDTPLRQVIDDLRGFQGINIVPDEQAMRDDGISLDTPVSMKIESISLKSALKLLLEQVRLTYVVADEVLKVTTPSHAHGKLQQRVYQVADLVIPLLQAQMPGDALSKLNGGAGGPNANQGMIPAGVTPNISRSALNQSQGSPVGSPGSGDPFAPAAPGMPQNGAQGAGGSRGPSGTLEQQLIDLITNTVQPRSWNAQGGPGTIDYFPLTMALVINQTLDIQEQIADLLAALRRLQDQEVAVEVRFITVAEGFFERIGLDFNINIKTDRETKAFEPQLTTGQFKPAGFINDFNPSRFIAGLTPAGTFTSDLDIPIRASSFAQAIPPFGGFQNIAGANGGLSLGLAFLSDIQVFLFMEAAQGDQRTNVMQAPKITLFNGQTSNIFVQDQQFFVTNVAVIQNGGQIAFVPQNQNFAVGVNLTLQAVISADRRFVRLNLNPNLTNLASAIVPLFPIVTPIFPIFDGGFPGNPVLFTQFIQQPVFNTINVQTSVAVPDGGTVLLGGLKRLSEGRNEFGPPVLSKLPYVNRLFKNVGYGREVESLMLMVTPRIIINEEEEIRQTGVIAETPPQAQ